MYFFLTLWGLLAGEDPPKIACIDSSGYSCLNFSVLAKLEKLEKTMQEIKLSLVTSQPDDDLTLDTILPNGKKLNTLNELSNFEKQLGEDDDIRN